MVEHSEEPIFLIPLEEIVPSPHNNRKTFDPAKLNELAETIKVYGVLQAAVVRSLAVGGYELVMGERRFRASKIAGLATLPCEIRDYTDDQVRELVIIENVQREEVNAAEESAGLADVLELPAYKAMGRAAAVEALAKKIGKSTSHVWQRLKLASLTDEAREELMLGNITPGHAILLARLAPEIQKAMITSLLWRTAYEKGKQVRYERKENGCSLSVRELAAEISSKAGIRLATAPFDLGWAPPSSVGEGRPCHGCPFRSLSDPAADANTIDFCTKPQCFHAKCGAHVDERIAEVHKALGRKPHLISLAYNASRKGAIGGDKYTECKEGAKDAEEAVVVDVRSYDTSYRRLGELAWITIDRPAKPDPKQAEREKKEKEERNRKLKTEADIRRNILEEVFLAAPGLPDVTLLRILAKELRCEKYSEDGALAVRDLLSMDVMPPRNSVKPEDFARYDVATLVRICLGLSVANVIVPNQYDVSSGQRPKSLETLAEAFGVDHERIRREGRGQAKLFDIEKPVSAPPPVVKAALPESAEKPTSDQDVFAWARGLALKQDPGEALRLDQESYDALCQVFAAYRAGDEIHLMGRLVVCDVEGLSYKAEREAVAS